MENNIYHCRCHRPDWSTERNDYCGCDSTQWEELDNSEILEICAECTYFYTDEN